jgi:ribose transport system permease protein
MIANIRLKKPKDLTIWGLLATMIILIIAFSFLNQYFLTLNNIINILLSISVIGIAAFSQTYVVISGGIDLSQESIIVGVGAIIALLNRESGIPMPILIIMGLLMGAFFGFINGIIITKARINPIIATLAMLGIVRGITLYFTSSQMIPINNDAFLYIGTGRVFGVIPLSVIILIIVFLVAYFILSQTVFGRRIYAVGGNNLASIFSGIKVDRIRIAAYVQSGTLSALAGIIFASITRWGAPTGGQGIIFRILTAVFLGGVALRGGQGKITGVAFGVVIIGIISNGLTLLGLRVSIELIIVGCILLISVILSQFRRGID